MNIPHTRCLGGGGFSYFYGTFLFMARCDKVENSQTWCVSNFINSASDLPKAIVTKHVRQRES